MTGGSQLAVAWFTKGEDGIPLVKFARSNDQGKTFSDPLVISEKDNIGRVAGAYLDDGSTVVAWLSVVSDESVALRMRHIPKEGSMGLPMSLTTINNSRGSGFPTLASNGELAIVSWTDSAKKTICTGLISLAD